MDALKSRGRVLGPALRTQPDRRLVALARDDSALAQEEIVRRYRAALVRYAGSIVGAAAAEDVVQESLAKGVAALSGAGEEPRLRPWLYAIVRNTALNHLRDAVPATEQLDENYDGVEQPPQALERRERVRSLFGGLRRLPQQQREAIVKRELEGRSHEEIAAELGVSSGAARQLIFRARESLRLGFGSLLPMPLLRWLAEGGAGDAAVGAAAGAGGGALAAKAAVAVFAAGAAVSAGVALDHGARQQSGPPAAEAAVRPATAVAPGPRATAPGAVLATAVENGGGGSSGGSDSGDDHTGPGSGDDRSGRGEDRGGESGSSGPGERSGSGRGDDVLAEDDSDDGGAGRGERSGHGAPGRSADEDDHSGSGSSHRGSDGDDARGGNGGSSGSGSSGSGGDGKRNSGSSGSEGGDDGSSGSDSSAGDSSGGDSSSGDSSSGDDGGGDDQVEDIDATAPATAPVEESSSGSGSSRSSGSGEGFAEDSRDLSSGSVSQGSDDPD